MPRASRYSPEVRERAVRKVFECEHEDSSQSAAILSIAQKSGCTRETLRIVVLRGASGWRIMYRALAIP